MENKFWMVWVPGHKAPKKMHSDYESAVTEAHRLRQKATSREVYVLAPVLKIPGRRILSIKPGQSPQSVKVEAKNG